MDEKLVNFEANFSVLDRYGENVTENEFVTNPAIGRDEQIKELILILLTPEKSAILIGKPGIGKTAIVEGLAYRIQKNDVPDALKGYTIINIKTASLLGTMPSGESKVQKMIDELKKRDKVILFIDEIHMLIGSTDSSSLDFANIFKEGLGRGSIKVIGATTTEEYERYILRDKAFTRRFQKVEVPEPTREETIKIMMGTLPKFEKQTGRKMKYTPFIQERIMSFIVDITSEYKRVFALGSRYPDVCLTLLKQAFSYTVYDNREFMDIFDVRKAIENSKNIYPDVIKKELPRFDKEFNDIILEEKGEKPVEEWRRDSAPTRYEQENKDDELKKLNSMPSIIDKKTLEENRPVKTILSEKTLNKFAKIGPTAVSRGFNEKFNQNSYSRNIDDLLLSGKIEVISNDKEDPVLPSKYTVTPELNLDNVDKLLLNKTISNTLEPEEKISEVEKYKSDNVFDKQSDITGNSLILEKNYKESNNDTYKDSNENNNNFIDDGLLNSDDDNNNDDAGDVKRINPRGDFLFGAPMYDIKNDTKNEKNEIPDGFQIGSNIKISNGKIVDNFVSKNNINNILTVDNRNDFESKLDDSVNNSINNNINNNDFSSSISNNPSLANKKWKFLPDIDEEKPKNDNVFNELKIPSNINSKFTISNIANDNQNENNFINFNNLNSGSLSPNIANNKSVNSENFTNLNSSKKSIDLKLDETDNDSDNYFDDFFDD